MSLFKELEGEAAILVERGVYRQASLFSRNNYLFAKYGTGFVRLLADGSTTKATLRLESLLFEGQLWRDGLGRIRTRKAQGCIPIPENKYLAISEG